MSKNQFTGTATQPQRNRKLCQFNKDQYCILLSVTLALHANSVDPNETPCAIRTKDV